jgi:heme/copper-type cytochrome/quinol oxidase subunit 2
VTNFLIFCAENVGLMVPGNDIMSAIVSLFLEVLSYGIIVLWCITVLLVHIVGFFSVVDTHTISKMDLWIDAQLNRIFGKNIYSFDPYNSQAYPRYFTKFEESLLDICFLVFPTIVVILMLVPTLGFLYNSHFLLYNVMDTSLSIDIIGHQWYWSYEYNLGCEDNDFMFDSILDIDAIVNAYLEVDNRLVIPMDLLINLTITSTDVIHSWAVPNLGIKVDAVPGRLSTSVLYTYVDGVFYGQCSELCGVLHGFMPICVEAVPLDVFYHWAMIQSLYLHNIY